MFLADVVTPNKELQGDYRDSNTAPLFRVRAKELPNGGRADFASIMVQKSYLERGGD